MSETFHEFNRYKKFLLNRVTASAAIQECIENCIASEDKAAKHFFHKIMVHNWQDTLPQLFDRLSTYYGTVLIPVQCTTQGDITTFYTSNLNLISKIIKFEFMFPYCRNMFSIDVLFNDKTSMNFFGTTTTIDEIVSGIVSRRFNETCELDLSYFCDDPEFTKNEIFFYKLCLLAQFKILMLRMGRDTKTLNLSNNNLNQVPTDLLNFFIKADLTAVNFSNNNIPSFTELQRVSSKIEKLWLEGNPLCEEIDPVTYVKTVTMKFPRLNELDGIELNQHGLMIPFFRNFLIIPDRKTKMLVEKFVTLYFSNYDQPPKVRRKKIEQLYDENAVLTITCNFSDTDSNVYQYTTCNRNMINPISKQYAIAGARSYISRINIATVLSTFPETIHDPSSFTVDVLIHDKKSFYIIIDGIFKERHSGMSFQFRRTFVFNIYTIKDNSVYHITNDMFSLTYPNHEVMSHCFKMPIRNQNSLTLINPSQEDREAIIKAFQHLTQLKKPEAELRLKFNNWDIREALRSFVTDTKSKKISLDLFTDDDDYSDTSLSSLLDEID